MIFNNTNSKYEKPNHYPNQVGSNLHFNVIAATLPARTTDRFRSSPRT